MSYDPVATTCQFLGQVLRAVPATVINSLAQSIPSAIPMLTAFCTWISAWWPGRFLHKRVTLTLLLGILCLNMVGCQTPPARTQPPQSLTPPSGSAVATFAGGCFWCMEKPFDELEGVLATTSGYTGGSVSDPNYYQVSGGQTGHAEAEQVTYDPKRISYEALLEVFWVNVDPFDAGGQFCDRGNQYRTSIFAHTPEQRKLAEASKTAIAQRYGFTQPIVTPIVDATTFYPAEDYHQNYYQNNPVRYEFYRTTCGRDRRLAQIWGKSSPPKTPTATPGVSP